ncbi:hypothetical protein [Bacteroides acidifaciens]|uniref:hypothetical protein n=1 Tax=Bacteroides acidifaciens TaxID=85831 RepID=UPI0026030665|nr:hypothetical protein [Bacteroides acidifaciens]MCX4334570.1 hypothetical protein [Bacteroidales bacterium]
MRNKIRAHFPDAAITRRNVATFYVADFSERTNSSRKIEIHSTPPCCPINPSNAMDCIEIRNPTTIDIDFYIFHDHQFKDLNGNDIEHCECCFYPNTRNDKSWIVMLEIKDCKPKNISKYKIKVLDQIISTATIFRKKHIITSHKVYGIVSFPRSKVSFNNTIFGMPPEYKALKKKYNILFSATNSIEVVSDSLIKHY